MLIRFTVENFLSFDQKQEINMLPAKGLKTLKNHVYKNNNISLLKSVVLYGANASGKSNFVKAITFAKKMILEGFSISSSNLYCRIKGENKDKPSIFEFEFIKNNKFYAYGFSINLQKQIILTEWLYELFPGNKKDKMLFERETETQRLELGEEVQLSEEEKKRFETYQYDFSKNKTELFLKEMNKKNIQKDSALLFFKEVFDWFDNNLVTIFPEQPINIFKNPFEDNNSKLLNLIKVFDTGITDIKKEIVEDIDELGNKIPKKVLEILKNRINEIKENNEVSKSSITIRGKDSFYNIDFVNEKKDNIRITVFRLSHSDTLFDYDEESDGTKRLLDLIEILLNTDENKTYIIDELERSLHPNLTRKFLELFFSELENSPVQLLFTTHESSIMDQNLLRRDEIWFVDKGLENTSTIYSLDRFNERYDKKLDKAYLEGRYGAVPIFKSLSLEKEDK